VCTRGSDRAPACGPSTSPLDATTVRPAVSFVALLPLAILGIIAVAVVMYNLPTAKEMTVDPLVIEAKEIPVFPAAQRLGDCHYSAKGPKGAKGLAIRLYDCKYTTTADFDSVRRFYGSEFEKRGWIRSQVFVLASFHLADWCKNDQTVEITYAHDAWIGWSYDLSFSVGVPPNTCGV
jgi:hypothetical protein